MRDRHGYDGKACEESVWSRAWFVDINTQYWTTSANRKGIVAAEGRNLPRSRSMSSSGMMEMWKRSLTEISASEVQLEAGMVERRVESNECRLSRGEEKTKRQEQSSKGESRCEDRVGTYAQAFLPS